MNAVALTAGRTRKVWRITVGAAGVNLVLVLVLTPALGLTGAAIAVTVGYLVLLVGVWLYSLGPDNPVEYWMGQALPRRPRVRSRLRCGRPHVRR